MGSRNISTRSQRNILRRLEFESLEPRRVMAGNVTAELVDGDLIITGDDEANTISIRGTDGTIVVESDGGFRVFAASSSSGDHPLSNPTQVNGEFRNAQFVGVTGNIVINAGGGNDRVVIRNVIYNGFSVSPSSFSALGDLIIDGGAGNDQIEVGEEIQPTVFTIPPGGVAVPAEPIPTPELFIAGKLQIDAGEEGGSVIVRPGTVGGVLEISAASAEGTHGNSISLFGVTASSCTIIGSDAIDKIFVSSLSVGGGLTVAAGLGDDTVDVDSLNAGGNSSIDLGAGTDLATVDGNVQGNLAVQGAAGSDTLVLGGEERIQFIQQHGDPNTPLRLMQLGAGNRLVVDGNLTVETGGGDFLNLQHTSVAGMLSIDSGESATREFIRIRHVSAGETSILAGGGNDVVNIALMTVRNRLTLDLGAGDDFLSMSILAFLNVGAPFPNPPVISIATILGQDGRDGIFLEGCFFESICSIEAGNGGSDVSVSSSVIDFLGISGGNGSDNIRTQYSLLRRLGVNGGNGSDHVLTRACAVDELFYDMGAGDDTIEMFGSVVREVADADGGAGFDTLKRLHSRIKQFNATNFEAGNDAGLVFA